MKICILGDGAWGTAIATLLAHNQYSVTVWCYDPQVADTVQQTGINERYLPDIQLDIHHITFTADIKEAVSNATWIMLAIPVKYCRVVLEQVKPFVQPSQNWVILSKGIEQNTLLFPTHIIDDVLSYAPSKVVLAGPSFAADLARKQLTAVTLASDDCDRAVQLQKLLATSYFRPYTSRDVVGVQVGAALKNVLALGIGIIEGRGFTDNAKAFLFTRGLNEMVAVAQALGGKQETLYGLSGVGDLVLTSMGNLSRNLEVGRQLGKGQKLETVLQETGYIPEGINTVQSLYQLKMRYNLDLPICTAIYQIIFEQKNSEQALTELMQRPLRDECGG